jgi:hypothetical protein
VCAYPAWSGRVGCWNAELLGCGPEAEFLDEIQTTLSIHSHLYSFPLRFLFLQIMPSLTFSTVQLLCTVKEKGGKPDRKPYPLSYGLRNPYKNIKSENSQYPETSTKTRIPYYPLHMV